MADLIATKLERLRTFILPLLSCTACGRDGLQLGEAALTCAGCGRAYPIHRGVPIMTDHPEEAINFSDDVVVGHVYSPHWLELIEKHRDGLVLDLGSGNNQSPIPHVVKMDIFPLPNVDVVGIAEKLPFRDGAFRAVISGAVFEHVMDPFRSIESVYRVLAEGGEVYIETAFLQPVHGFPHHYYNMTRRGLENLCRSFQRIESGVQPHQSPGFMLNWIIKVWVNKMSVLERHNFYRTTMAEILKEYEKDVFSQRWMTNFSQEDREELACGVYFRGTKGPHRAWDMSLHPPPGPLDPPTPWEGLMRRLRRLRKFIPFRLS